ncbi:DUF6083 domain-containing protein [Kitasatospora sp. NPDC059646]|uniref:DUF6083 domain-containing protein n=1 Tax=Kitasatospora sp. NPDC059646 TaxID=3346893 RepID=UPI0036AB15F3
MMVSHITRLRGTLTMPLPLTRGLTAARLDPWSPSKTLRADATGTCNRCGNPVEWYDRADGGRIPMLHGEFPAKRVPFQYRWSVEGGVARRGSYGRVDLRCRIPHPTVCPNVDHTGLDPVMLPMVQALAVRTRKMIENGTFTPPIDEDVDEDAAQEVEPEPQPEAEAPTGRHVLAWGGRLRIAPCRIDDVRCIAWDDNTDDRCERTLFDIAEGAWEQIPVPAPSGRRNRGPRGAMWVWELSPLDYRDALRWIQQRCTEHNGGNAPDAVPNEFVDFNADRHGRFIIRRRPEGYARPAPTPADDTPAAPRTTNCAGGYCSNTTVVAVGPDWLCYSCERTQRRRVGVHRRWQQSSDQKPHRRPWERQEGPQW